jgi:hypothetical protein
MTVFDDVATEMLADGVTLTEQTVWNFLLRLNLAYRNDLPAIVESNLLSGNGIWVQRARTVSAWLRVNLASRSLSDAELSQRLGVAHRSDPNRETQSGLALEDGVAYLIEKFCGVTPMVRRNFHDVAEHALLRKGEADQIDLMIERRGKLLAAISCLWTSRRDRVGADVYDSVVFKQRRPEVPFVIVTNEYQASILQSLLASRYVDAVYHVSKQVLLEAWNFGLSDTDTLGGVRRSADLSRRLRTTVQLDSELVDIKDLFPDLRKVLAAFEN